MEIPAQLADAPFTTAQALEAGLTRGSLRRLLREHRIVRVLQGVYGRADLPDTMESRARAAALVVTPGAVAVDRLAAWILGVDTLEPRELEELPPLEMFVLRGHARIKRRGCQGGERDLLPADIIFTSGLRVTSPLRTAMDLGCKLSRRGALASLDAFMRHWGITHAQMYALLPRYYRRRGVVQLRQLIPLADPRAESPGESWARLEIIDAGMPCPKPQHWIVIDGVPVFRLDLAYPELKICVEYDGEEFHGEAQKEYDEARRKWLRDHGWIVIVVRKDDFTGESLDAWLRELREGIADRS
jgi:hypothetical protein